MSGQSKKHTLKGGTSPYSLSMGVPPQGGGGRAVLVGAAYHESNH